jgi:hypothetical protein
VDDWEGELEGIRLLWLKFEGENNFVCLFACYSSFESGIGV